MSLLSRGRFLSAAAGAAVASQIDWVRPALAQPAAAKLTDIDHIVVLMQENRSFDHYYGTMSGVRGYDDAAAAILPDGRPVFYQPDRLNSDGYVLPFHLDTKTTSAQRLHDLSHAWSTLHHSWNDGKFDGWVSAHRASDGASGPLTMGHYTRADIPFYYALADAFTICDGYHASVMGPTDPNRYYWMTATIDPNGRNGGPVTNNRDKRYTWETYAQRLETAGVSWRIYRPESSLEFPVALDVIMNFPIFADAPATSPFYENAAKLRSVDNLLSDIRTANLPQVTWIVPPYDVCEHPDMLPAAGENYVRRILEAFWSNRALWSKTAFVIVYDENDGLFDHVVPPTPPPGTPDEYVKGVPIGLGFRVPCLVISPFSRGGFVYSGTLDHTASLRLMEARFGVEVPNLSRWRRETTADLTAAFGFGTPADPSVPNLPATAAALATVEKQVAILPRPNVPSIQKMPKQEAAAFVRRRRT
jgi:phospholipase C